MLLCVIFDFLLECLVVLCICVDVVDLFIVDGYCVGVNLFVLV